MLRNQLLSENFVPSNFGIELDEYGEVVEYEIYEAKAIFDISPIFDFGGVVYVIHFPESPTNYKVINRFGSASNHPFRLENNTLIHKRGLYNLEIIKKLSNFKEFKENVEDLILIEELKK